jgi:hypothetical protein
VPRAVGTAERRVNGMRAAALVLAVLCGSAWDALRLDRKESRILLEPMLPPESPSSREP